MCGIAARIGTGGLATALELMAHRGLPGRSRMHVGRWGGIGHVRLPIVGVSTEHDQPVQCGHWTIAFVGQVLDFRDRNPGAECDLSVVTDGWVNHGPGALAGRDGFWSIVAMNERDGTLHVVCDYLAQKPMYYRADSLAVASELDAVASFDTVTPDEVYLSAVIKWGYCPDPVRTPYAEVKRVQPGEHVRLWPGGKVDREIVDPITPYKMHPSELRAEIVHATRRRVQSSDVPVACLLSGGLDSSIVYTIAKEYADVEAYYVRVEGEDYGAEAAMLARAQSVARPGGLTIVTGPESLSLNQALSVMQEPIDLGSLLPQTALSNAVEQRVCLTGDGADEMFGGYGRAERYDSQGSDVFQELVSWHLPRLDRVMMRNTIETRSPFLARKVVEAAFALPWGQRCNKNVLKNIFRDILPPDVADQPKVPLRTNTIQFNRERNSRFLVQMFREDKWPS